LYSLKQYVEEKPKYKYEIESDREVGFIMVNLHNQAAISTKLDEFRLNRPKFICINDDIENDINYNNSIIEKMIQNFYLSMFPKPSSFEIAEDQINEYLYYDELMNMYNTLFFLKCFAVSILVFIFLCIYAYYKRYKDPFHHDDKTNKAN